MIALQGAALFTACLGHYTLHCQTESCTANVVAPMQKLKQSTSKDNNWDDSISMHSWCVVDTPKDNINTISALVFHELVAVLTVRARTGTTRITPFSSQVCPFNTSKVQVGVVSHSSTCAALHMGGYKALTMKLRVSGQKHATLAVRANSISLGFRADPSLMAVLMFGLMLSLARRLRLRWSLLDRVGPSTAPQLGLPLTV